MTTKTASGDTPVAAAVRRRRRRREREANGKVSGFVSCRRPGTLLPYPPFVSSPDPQPDSAAIPPPAALSTPAAEPEKKPEEKNGGTTNKNTNKPCLLFVSAPVVESALEELSRTKAQKANPFAKPKLL